MLRVLSGEISCMKYVEAMKKWWNKSESRNREP
jgi:hypothetical protein